MTNDIWQLDEVTKKSLNLSIHSDKGNALEIQASITHMSTLIFFSFQHIFKLLRAVGTVGDRGGNHFPPTKTLN